MYRKSICIVSGTALLKFILFKNFRTHERNFVSHSPHLFHYSFGKKKTKQELINPLLLVSYKIMVRTSRMGHSVEPRSLS